MSEHSDPREQADASAEQDLELKDLAVQGENADQVRGGQPAAPPPKPAPKGVFEVQDYGFDIEQVL
jgi:hypothetical protein